MKKIITLLLIYILTIGVFGQIETPKYPDVTKGRGSGSKSSENDKLSLELRILYAQYRTSKSKGDDDNAPLENAFSAEQLNELFGIESDAGANPSVSIAVTTEATNAVLKEKGMKIYMRLGNIVYGEAPVLELGNLAMDRSVKKIAATKSTKNPELPKDERSPMNSKGSTNTNRNAKPTVLANEFNKANLTGKGVIVGVIDTGIDWRHPDFLRADGTSRIIAIWDIFDKSFQRSNGQTGTSPPMLEGGTDTLPGTIYTNAQINAALKNQGTVNTVDNNGHGTAVAGTAAGNGGKLGAKFAGVATDTDIIVFKGADCKGFSSAYLYGAAWMAQTAQQLKRPIVVNLSLGGHWSAHDGTEQEEVFLNSLTGKGKPGVIFTVSAGNEGNYSFRGAGVFGPKRAGQEDVESSPITLNIPPERNRAGGTEVLGVFDSRDEWGAIVQPMDKTTPFLDKNQKPMWFAVFKSGGEIKYLIPDKFEKPDWFDRYMQSVVKNSQLGEKSDMLAMKLPNGSYRLYGIGVSEKVANGNFSFYAPRHREADFGIGTNKTMMVGSPGNATNVITVGAYDFRANWMNMENTETIFNMTLGTISGYSSPGGMRLSDKVYKPDIAAPATYTISSLSQNSKPDSPTCDGDNMGAGYGARYVTPDGLHIAWDGTSASSPFTAGVIALMLQKNPRLDAEQVRQILRSTATKGNTVGAVPNPSWGYGMLNPAAAIKATPIGKK